MVGLRDVTMEAPRPNSQMSIESIPVFETTIQKTDIWLKNFQQEIGQDINKDQAYHLM
jgi:hypothetical protein